MVPSPLIMGISLAYGAEQSTTTKKFFNHRQRRSGVKFLCPLRNESLTHRIDDMNCGRSRRLKSWARSWSLGREMVGDPTHIHVNIDQLFRDFRLLDLNSAFNLLT